MCCVYMYSPSKRSIEVYSSF